MLVPRKRLRPETNFIELAFVRFKSTAKNPGPPIAISRGPGGPHPARLRARVPLFMALRDVADVIAFDQVARSLQTKPELLRPSVMPSTWLLRQAAWKMRAGSRNCAAYWREVQRVDLNA